MAFTGIQQRPRQAQTFTTLQSLGSILQENRHPSGGLTKFATVLLHVATHLTKEEFSLMKLALIANDSIQAKKADNISSAADLLSFMYLRKFISKDDMSLLMELLVNVQRRDLYEELYNYLQHRLGAQQKPLYGSAQQREVSLSSTSCVFDQSRENDKDYLPDSLDEELDLPNSQNSQSSMSDDDKMNQLEKRKALVESPIMDTSSP